MGLHKTNAGLIEIIDNQNKRIAELEAELTAPRNLAMKIDRSRHPTSLLLKACPFCGEDGTRNDSGLKPELTRVEATAINSPHATGFGVQCGRCGARTVDCPAIETAVERWNARP